jgi:F-type H+-transporting ATPase subunit gamma
MQQLREIRHRITSIDEIRQITKAMYTIALSRTFRLKEQLAASRAYAEGAEEVLQAILEGLEGSHPLTQAEGRYLGLFVVNADRGLCGRFPDELNLRTERLLADDTALICGGERARRHFARRPVKIIKEYVNFYDRPAFSQAREIAQDLLDLFQAGKLGRIDAVYMRFINDFRQEVVVEHLLPFRKEATERPARPQSLRLYEPSPEGALEGFAGQYLAAKVYNILVESKTSEQAIRRQAMKNATDNADELIGDLTLEFNKARQQAITREIADIIGGAEALRGER